jgi:serine/threonine protein kinase
MSDALQDWFRSCQFANIDGIELAPRPHPVLAGYPFEVSRGQAKAYYLLDSNNQHWILKKFLPAKSPDARYINAIQALIPREPGLESGFERKVLHTTNIAATGYCTQDFANWIANTILMPVVRCDSWADLADAIRDGRQSLHKDQRTALCENLSEKIRCLERNGLSHRDLSSTNVFVDLQKLEVHLIDWDSLYHSTLSMPAQTTFGTDGYIAPFVKVNGIEDPTVSWTTNSDRFSLAILNAELLGLGQGSPITHDGGAVDQYEIYSRGGRNITDTLDRVRLNCPKAARLIEASLNATSYDQCPSPDDWLRALRRVGIPSEAKGADAFDGARFVRVNNNAFVTLNQAAFVRPPLNI